MVTSGSALYGMGGLAVASPVGDACACRPRLPDTDHEPGLAVSAAAAWQAA